MLTPRCPAQCKNRGVRICSNLIFENLGEIENISICLSMAQLMGEKIRVENLVTHSLSTEKPLEDNKVQSSLPLK